MRRRVSVIAATSTPANLVAKAATTTIPIVFTTGGDPVKLGLVTSLGRPGGNVTGVTQMTGEVAPKRVELAHELVPQATAFGMIINPTNPLAETVKRNSQAAALKLGLQLNVLHASTEAELDKAFTAFREMRVGALVIGTDAFFNNRLEQLAALAIRNSLPVVYEYHQFVAAGGLVSYGGSIIIPIASLAGTLAVSSRARNPPTCRSNRQAKSSCSSTSRLQRHSASPCRSRYKIGPMK